MCGSPAPRLRNSQLLASCWASSTLLTTRSDRPSAAQRPARGVGVLVDHAGRDVNDEQHEVRARERRVGLLGDLGLEGVAGFEPTAGVDDVEGEPVPFDLDGLAVAGDAAMLLDDRRRACRRVG